MLKEIFILRELFYVPRSRTCKFVQQLYRSYVQLHFTYLEINPLVITDKQVSDSLPRRL